MLGLEKWEPLQWEEHGRQPPPRAGRSPAVWIRSTPHPHHRGPQGQVRGCEGRPSRSQFCTKPHLFSGSQYLPLQSTLAPSCLPQCPKWSFPESFPQKRTEVLAGAEPCSPLFSLISWSRNWPCSLGVRSCLNRLSKDTSKLRLHPLF